uniref:NifU family protein n=1 Tax=Thermofilum pendens TaxID=2269 RepID=A0A7C3WJA8_THEPE
MEASELVKAVECAVEEFNRTHGSEGQARLLEVSGDRFRVEFRGSFCLTCGFYDYFEDFAYLLKDCGVRAGVSAVEEVEGGALVEYRLLGEGEEWRFAPERVFLILE